MAFSLLLRPRPLFLTPGPTRSPSRTLREEDSLSRRLRRLCPSRLLSARERLSAGRQLTSTHRRTHQFCFICIPSPQPISSSRWPTAAPPPPSSSPCPQPTTRPTPLTVHQATIQLKLARSQQPTGPLARLQQGSPVRADGLFACDVT